MAWSIVFLSVDNGRGVRLRILRPNTRDLLLEVWSAKMLQSGKFRTVALGRALETSADKKEAQQLSLRLAHAYRRSLDKSWGINAWTTPDDAATKIDDSYVTGWPGRVKVCK